MDKKTQDARIKKWVEALRSGEYAQGKNVLRDGNNRYCCLGVACEIYHQETGKGEWRLSDSAEYYFFEDDNQKEPAVLPNEVVKWLGIKSTLGGWQSDEAKSLVILNDGGEDFNEIANVIESRPEGMFHAPQDQ